MRILSKISQRIKSFYLKWGRWGVAFFFLIFLALISPFLANDKPYYCQYNNENYFPLFGDEITSLEGKTYKELNLTSSVFPPISFTAKEVSPFDRGLSKPFTSYHYKMKSFTHYLGTDRHGRDVASGIVRGLRVAMMIGLGTMMLAGFIGVFWGLISGYYENDRFNISLLKTIVFGLLSLFSIYLIYLGYQYAYLDIGSIWIRVFFIILVGFGCLGFVVNIIDKRIKSRKIAIPIDTIFTQKITILNTIPKLLFILLVLSIVKEPSIMVLIMILGLLMWTTIARYVRAETLKVKVLPYIKTLENFEIKPSLILWKHILPNVVSPIVTTLSFGVAGAILAETFLSFLGLGLGLEEVTWGSMLNQARQNFTAWWLVVFPGMALFFTLWFFNKLGQKVIEILDPYYELDN